MRKFRGIAPILIVLIPFTLSAQEPRIMGKSEFAAFVQSVYRQSQDWKAAVSAPDVSSIKDLPYKKGKLMANSQRDCEKAIESLQQDLSELGVHNSMRLEVFAIADFGQVINGLDGFINNLTVENEVDIANYQQWEGNLTEADKEVNHDFVKMLSHVVGVAKVVDRRVDISNIAELRTNR